VLVEHECDVGFERQARAFEDDFWRKFGHLTIIKANKFEIFQSLLLWYITPHGR